MLGLPGKRLTALGIIFTALIAGCGGGLTTSSAPPAKTTPDAPTDVIASAHPGSVQIVWSSSANAVSYNIYRYALTPNSFLSIAALSKSAPIANVAGLLFKDASAQVGTDYMYIVTSVDGNNNESNMADYSNHSCSTPYASSFTGPYPAIRPLVYMAAHGSNGVSVATSGNSVYYPDPTPAQVAAAGFPPLLQTNGVGWETVASCLDGIWGNYAHVSVADEQSLYNMVNSRNTIAEEDIVLNKALLDPTMDTSYNPPNLSLNRRGMEIYASDPATLGNSPNANDSVDTTLATLKAVYSNGSSPATSYARIYTGFNLNRWVNPNSQTSGIPPGVPGVYTYPAATSVFLNANGDIQECNPGRNSANFCDNSTSTIAFQQGFLNNLIQTHVDGGNFILFFTVGGIGPGDGPGISGFATTGAFAELQKLYNFISSQPCRGTYDAPPGHGGASAPYNFCDANNDPGLWRPEDVILIINYFGWYPPTPQYTRGAMDDNVTGMLQWLIRQ